MFGIVGADGRGAEAGGGQSLGDIGPGPVIAVPYLMGGGAHVAVDIPCALGIDPVGNAPWAQEVDGHLRVCDRAIGDDPGLVGLVLDLAQKAWTSMLDPQAMKSKACMASS